MSEIGRQLDLMNVLVDAVQELSLARDINRVTTIVRTAARKLMGADGATFVLRDGDLCYYADEDAISPLWKGQRFPMSACVSGWVMEHKCSTVIPDIYADPRVPADAYRPTFVKSMSMVPIRLKAPLGAIGCYWSSKRELSAAELKLVEALANSTSIAIENIQLYNELEARVNERTKDLESFSYSVSHDLKAPLRRVAGFAEAIRHDMGSDLKPEARNYITRIQTSATEMNELIDALLKLANDSRGHIQHESVDLSQLATEILKNLAEAEPKRRVETDVQAGVRTTGDAAMLRAVLENLLRNAWKFTRQTALPRIEFGSQTDADGKSHFFVRDNGAGFDPAYADRLFRVFQRLHSTQDFEGTGIGLATVHRIVSRHNGRVWARSEKGKGAQFCFAIPSKA